MTDIVSTEKINPDTVNIDISSSLEIVRMINNEDMKIAVLISKHLEKIAKAADIISGNFLKGGKLFYFGAGTSGRLGVLDASECPPTYNTPYDMVQGIIAGGDNALRHSAEGAEDSIEEAGKDFENADISCNDTVVSISASGNAGYVVEILNLAKEKCAKTIAITCNPKAKISKLADVSICIETGAEVIAGSTRMKAGTAQKMVLNMLSTCAMIKIGKVYKNFMVDVKPLNIKLKNRAERIVSDIAGCDILKASQTLKNNGYKVKEAVLQIKYSMSFESARKLLEENNGILRKIFNKF